jgi:hypothetical protein
VRDEAKEREPLRQQAYVREPVRIGEAEGEERADRRDRRQAEPASRRCRLVTAERRREPVHADDGRRDGGERARILRPGREPDGRPARERMGGRRPRGQAERRVQRHDDEERQQDVGRDDAALHEVDGEHRHEECGDEPRRGSGDDGSQRRDRADRRDGGGHHHEAPEADAGGDGELLDRNAVEPCRERVGRGEHVHGEGRVGGEAGVEVAVAATCVAGRKKTASSGKK